MRSKTALFILALSAGLFSGGGLLAPALAQLAGQAQPTTAHGLTEAQLREKLEAAGFRSIEKIERKPTHYEVNAADRDGRRFELSVHPVTAEITTTIHRDHRLLIGYPAGAAKQ